MAAGTASAKARAYYAHKQNKFWKILHETGLTPALLQPHQYRDLLQHRIGLTDLVKTHSGMDHQIPLSELRLDARSRLSAFDRGIPAEIPGVHQQGGRARISRRQARLRRAG